MNRKFQIIGLGNPVVATVLADKELRHEAGNAVGKGIKISASVVGVIALFFVGKHIVKKIKEKHRANKDLKNETADLDKKQVTKEDSWFDNKVSVLRKALQLDEPCWNDTTRSYAEDTIVSVINGCGNQHDWLYLVKKFGKQTGKVQNLLSTSETEPRTLVQWLGYDDDGDIAKYNAALSKLDVPENAKIVKLQ